MCQVYRVRVLCERGAENLKMAELTIIIRMNKDTSLSLVTTLFSELTKWIVKDRSLLLVSCLCCFLKFEGLLFTIVMEHLGYRKLCARLVSKMLSENNKWKMVLALTYLTCYNDEGKAFFKSIVTRYEIWIRHDNPKTK